MEDKKERETRQFKRRRKKTIMRERGENKSGATK
jgi:hypothetical protein